MKRQHIRSSNIASIGYDIESQTLEIEFHSGGVYHFYAVPKRLYEGLINASSHGSYFHQHIKGRFGDKKVG